GVYELVGGTLQGTTTNTWRPMGIDLPKVQVRDLVLNQVTNTLLAATYGRSVYVLYLTAAQTAPVVNGLPAPLTAPLTAVTGASVWDAPVVLDPNAGRFAVYGNPSAPNL